MYLVRLDGRTVVIDDEVDDLIVVLQKLLVVACS
jgi:hypothetical protein